MLVSPVSKLHLNTHKPPFAFLNPSLQCTLGGLPIKGSFPQWAKLSLDELDHLWNEEKTAAEFQLLTEGSRQTLTAWLCRFDTPDIPSQSAILHQFFLVNRML